VKNCQQKHPNRAQNTSKSGQKHLKTPQNRLKIASKTPKSGQKRRKTPKKRSKIHKNAPPDPDPAVPDRQFPLPQRAQGDAPGVEPGQQLDGTGGVYKGIGCFWGVFEAIFGVFEGCLGDFEVILGVFEPNFSDFE
jgi:hypothetical protein